MAHFAVLSMYLLSDLMWSKWLHNLGAWSFKSLGELLKTVVGTEDAVFVRYLLFCA